MPRGDPHPADPRDEGVEEREPEAMQVEPAHILATEAKDRLKRRGFEEEQILTWAEAYIAEEGSGDVDHFVTWIADREAEA